MKHLNNDEIGASLNEALKMSSTKVASSANNELVIRPIPGVWYFRKDHIPDSGRVLTFSPDYEHDESMLFRMMDARFVKISRDVEQWQLPLRPDAV